MRVWHVSIIVLMVFALMTGGLWPVAALASRDAAQPVDAESSAPAAPAGPSSADGWVSGMTGEQLLSFCQQTVRVFDKKEAENDLYSTFCLGYVQGYTDGYVMAKNDINAFCLPPGTTGEALARTFVEKMQGKGAEELKMPAVPLLLKALNQAYPCQ